MATPNLTTEVTAFPKFPLPRPTGYDRSLTVFEDKASQTRLVSTSQDKQFKLDYANQSDSEWASFETFFNAQILAGTPFYWNDIRNGVNDIKVHFLESKVTPTPTGPRTWSWSVTLIRVIS